MSGNQIKSLDELKPLDKCEKLESIDVSNNPVSKAEAGGEATAHVKLVREILPKVEVIDGYNREGQEVVSEDDEDDDEDEDDEDDEDDDDDDDDDVGDEDDDEEGEDEDEEGDEDDEEDEEEQ